MIRPVRIYRVLFLFLVSYFLSLVIVTPVSAQSYSSPNVNPDVPKNLNTLTQNVFIEVLNAATCQLVGVSASGPSQKCLGFDQTTGKVGFVENGGGMIGLTTQMITALYTPPAHMSDYTRNMAANFGIVKPAYAQYANGFGFESISPLIGIWKIFRNIVYLLFVLVFIVIGVAIMLRIHIDPRTVMSVENQIPKIIIALILVNFSFPIAGFMIDAMWTSTYVVIRVLAQADPEIKSTISVANSNLYLPPLAYTNEVLQEKGGDTGGGILRYAWYGAGSVREIVASLFSPKFLGEAIVTPEQAGCKGNIFTDPICQIKDVFAGTIASVVGNALGYVLSWIVGSLAFFVFAIAILVALFRLWLQLLIAYIYLLLDIVLSPFWILASLFPGSTLSFSSWIRELLADLAPFPVAVTFILLGKVFMNAFAKIPPTTPPPVPLIGNFGDQGVLSALVGIGFILLVPSVTQMARDIFKAPAFKYGQVIGQSVGAGTGAVSSTFGGMWSRAWKVSNNGEAIGVAAERLATFRGGALARLFGIRGVYGGATPRVNTPPRVTAPPTTP